MKKSVAVTSCDDLCSKQKEAPVIAEARAKRRHLVGVEGLKCERSLEWNGKSSCWQQTIADKQ